MKQRYASRHQRLSHWTTLEPRATWGSHTLNCPQGTEGLTCSEPSLAMKRPCSFGHQRPHPLNVVVAIAAWLTSTLPRSNGTQPWRHMKRPYMPGNNSIV